MPHMEGIHSRIARGAPFLSWMICAVLLAYALFLVPKFWLTNDDSGMAMLACGYGISDSPSPYLIFSNALWGWAISSQCGISDSYSYDYMSYVALALAALATGWALHRRRTPAIITAALVTAIYVPGILRPQFTLVSGHLAAGALLLLYTQDEDSRVFSRAAPWALLFLSALIRLDEFLVVCAVSAPFFLMGRPWHASAGLIRSYALPASLLLLAVVGAYGAESHIHRQDPAWNRFEQLSAMRPILDFHLADSIAAHPEVLQGSGMTPNDIALINKWFFADPTVFDPGKVAMVTDRIPFAERLRIDLTFYRRALNPFLDPQFALLAALFLLSLPFLRPRLPAACAGLLILLLMVATLLAGRPGLTRIFIPLMALVDCLALASWRPGRSAIFTLGSVVAFVCTITLCAFQLQSSRLLESQTEGLRKDYSTLQGGRLYVVWAGYFPDVYLNQPFGHDPALTRYSLYGLDSWQRAPFALDTLHRYTGGLDLVPALLHGQDFKIFALGNYLGLLQTFFREHYHSTLHATKLFTLDRYTCYQISVTPDTP